VDLLKRWSAFYDQALGIQREAKEPAAGK